MGCRSDYMMPNPREIYLSRVKELLTELESGVAINKNNWQGYHPDIYCKHLSNVDGDKLTATLCSMLQGVDTASHSLELQTWWRDHQETDKARIAKEESDIIDNKDREVALSKLTQREKTLLDL